MRGKRTTVIAASALFSATLFVALAMAATVAALHAPALALHGDELWGAGARAAPRFALRDQTGRTTRLTAAGGRPTIVTFLYSHCHDICPVEGELLGEVARSFIGSAVQPRFLVISVDPAGDTPRSIRGFALRWGWTGDWHWLSGSKRQLARVWRSYSIEVQGARPSVGHSTALYIVDDRGYERSGYAVPFLSRNVISDLQQLQAGSGRRVQYLLLAGAGILAAIALGLIGAGAVFRGGTVAPDAAVLRTASRTCWRPRAQLAPMRTLRLGLLAGATCLLIAGTLWPARSNGTGVAGIIPAGVRALAPSLDSAPLLVPPPVSLTRRRGRVVLLNFWASWCYPCQQEAPVLARFGVSREGRGRLIGVDVNDQHKPALRFVERYRLGYPNVSDDRAALFDRYGLVGLPTTVVIDSSGRIAARLIGPQTIATLRCALAHVR